MNQATEQTRTLTPFHAALCLCCAGLLVTTLAGCGKKGGKMQGRAGSQHTETATEIAPEQAKAPEQAPAPERHAERNALKGLDLDPKVSFPKINEPTSRDVAGAVAALAAAIAEGDSRALHPMLDEPNQAILDELVESGVWQSSTESITKVRVCTLEEDGETLNVGLGIEDEDGAYLLGWTGKHVGGGWLFSGIALDTPAEAMTAVELDGGSLASRDLPELGAIIDDTFDPTANDPRREGKNRRRRGGRRSSGGGGGRRGL